MIARALAGFPFGLNPMLGVGNIVFLVPFFFFFFPAEPFLCIVLWVRLVCLFLSSALNMDLYAPLRKRKRNSKAKTELVDDLKIEEARLMTEKGVDVCFSQVEDGLVGLLRGLVVPFEISHSDVLA